MHFDQSEFDVRCEWGRDGGSSISTGCDVLIVVDVLSFSTCVDVVVSRGALVYPYQHGQDSAREFSDSIGAVLAGPRGESRLSLSPASLQTLASGSRLVLPSLNGATMTLESRAPATFAGCLRNARSVGKAALEQGKRIAVIPAGELWPDGTLRPCFEDWIGAGAIIDSLSGRLSPEAEAARDSFRQALPSVLHKLKQSGSGKELIQKGFAPDIEIAAQVNSSQSVPVLVDGAYVDRGTGRVKSLRTRRGQG
ncbi:MAG: 2-phosphosulfolactate phosphatase [Candidatus Zixiibacteriota bacterium]